MPLSITDQLTQHEDEVLHAYQDSLGYWTIGIGRLIDARKGGSISHEEALLLLDNDVKAVRAQLTRSFPWWLELDDVRQRVLIDMCFNMGFHTMSTFKMTLAYIKGGDYTGAANAMRHSLWHTQVGNRAERLARMMESGEDVGKWW